MHGEVEGGAGKLLEHFPSGIRIMQLQVEALGHGRKQDKDKLYFQGHFERPLAPVDGVSRAREPWVQVRLTTERAPAVCDHRQVLRLKFLQFPRVMDQTCERV